MSYLSLCAASYLKLASQHQLHCHDGQLFSPQGKHLAVFFLSFFPMSKLTRRRLQWLDFPNTISE